jgi:heme-degrading monooxygenase HmoA
MHTAGETGGKVVVFDVWESREDFDRFIKQYIEPAMEEGQEGEEPEVYELANLISPALATTR